MSRPAIRVALCLSAGVMGGLGHVPFALPGVALAGLSLGLGVIAATSFSARSGFAAAWWMAVGYFVVSLFWIVEPFQVDAQRHGWMAPFALFFMATGLALFWGAAGALACYRSRSTAGRLGALVVAMGVMELARGYVLTGFPWALVGYVWTETGPRGWATLVGSYGLSVLTLALAALVAAVVLNIRRPVTVVATAVFAVAFFAIGPRLLPPERSDIGRPVVRLVQPNAAQDEKWLHEMIPVFFNRQVAYTGAPSVGEPLALIVWPETAIPYVLGDAVDVGLTTRIANAAGGTPVVLGANRRDAESGLLVNSLALIGEGGVIETVYDKHHLVPFGEYIPFPGLAERMGLRAIAQLPGQGFSPGPGAEVISLGQAGTGLPLICYEAIFPQDVHASPQRPDFLLQITNDAWFGTFAGPYQHLAQAKMRAVEQGLPLARSANTGVSAMIDAAGRVTAQVPLGVAGFVDATLPPPEPPTVYSRVTDWPIGLILVLCLAATLARRMTFRD